MPKGDRYVDLEAGAVTGSFRDGLCQCCNDLGSCCCALFGGMPCLLGQLYEKVVGCRCSCCAIVFVYYGLMAAGVTLIYYGGSAYVAALNALISESGPASLYEQIMKGAFLLANQATLKLLMLGGGVLCFVVSSWWFTCVTAKVYAEFRKRYGIDDTMKINVCGCCLDLCCALNFPCCVITQMARHLGPAAFPPCSCLPAPGGFWLWDQSSWPEYLVKRAPTLLSRQPPRGEEPKKHPQSRHSPRGEARHSPREEGRHSPRGKGPYKHPARQQPPPQDVPNSEEWPEDDHIMHV
jgi:hypothetical protein